MGIKATDLPASVRDSLGIPITTKPSRAKAGTGAHSRRKAKRRAEWVSELANLASGVPVAQSVAIPPTSASGHGTVTLPYPPSVNSLYATYQGRRIKSREGRKYLAEAQRMLQAAGVCMETGPVRLSIDIYRPRKTGDLSNRVKALEDCLTGVWIRDDEQVVELHMRRFDDKANPRAEIRIEPV